MSTQLQRRRGTTVQHSTFTGAEGELTVDTTKDTAVVHDGTTAGGHPLLKEAAIGVSVQAYDADLTTLGAGGSGARSFLGLAIGTDVQAYDVDTAKTDVTQTFTTPQRGTQTTDNDLSFNLATTNFWNCTPSGGGALTFTNIPTGQGGTIKFVNGSNYAITAAATTKVTSTFLATISATGTYILSYYADGTNVYVSTAGAMA
jgi:hypothetical protein